MRNHIPKLYGVAAAAALMIGTASYGAPITYYFLGTEAPIWDVTGNYTLSPTVGEEEPVSIVFDVYVFQESKGPIYGDGSTIIYLDGVQTEGSYQVKGKLKTENAYGNLKANVKASGVGYLEGDTRSYSLSAKYDLTLDPMNLAIYGQGKGKAKAKGLGSAKLDDDFYEFLPFGMDGDWSLTVDVSPDGKKWTGWALLELTNGREIQYDAKGETSKKGITKIKLKGLGEAKNSKLKLTMEGESLLMVEGKVLGQKVDW
jgi:hypothetical protein